MGIFGPPNVQKMMGKHDVAGLIKALGYEKDGAVRRDAAEALGELGDQRAVEPLLGALEDFEVFRVAIRALGKLGDERAVLRLVPFLITDTFNADVRGDAARALGEIGGLTAVEALTAALNSPDAKVRKSAAGALRQMGWKPDRQETRVAYRIASREWGKASALGSAAVGQLITALDDEDSGVRKGAARALRQIGKPAVKPLVAAIRNDALFDVSLACEVLGDIGEPAVPPLVAFLEGKGGTRWLVPAVLAKIGDARAIGPLVAALRDEHVREDSAAALEALGWKPDRSEAGAWYWVVKGNIDNAVALGAPAVEPLISSLGAGDRAVRADAARALVVLYREGELDEASRQRILDVRKTITRRHQDAESCFGHTDKGIGVAFPL